MPQQCGSEVWQERNGGQKYFRCFTAYTATGWKAYLSGDFEGEPATGWKGEAL